MRLLRLFFRNFLYKVVALVVAVVLWAATQGFRSVDASVDLTVAFADQPDELVVIGQSAREVNFKLVGSRWAVRRATQELDSYTVSLAATSPGEVRFQVDPSRFPLPRGAEISAWSPSNLSVKLDSIIEKSVRVRADTFGKPPEGSKVEGVVIEPAIVALRGAKSVLTPLREVATERIDLGSVRESTVVAVPLTMGRSNIWPVEGEELRVQVSIQLVPDPATAPLVELPSEGEPESGPASAPEPDTTPATPAGVEPERTGAST